VVIGGRKQLGKLQLEPEQKQMVLVKQEYL
jgi:hypothetical protein